MLSMQDMFYSKPEPVWIEKPPSAEEKKKQAAEKEKKEEEEYSILTAIPRYPYYYPPYNPPPPSAAAKDGDKKKETKLALRVSICCTECVEVIDNVLKKVPGVKDVECDIMRKKVVVTCTTAAPTDVMLAARREFKGARQWTDDDL